MMSKCYISKIKLIELKSHFLAIIGFFRESEKREIEEFLFELEETGECDLDKTSSIYALLNNIHRVKVDEKRKKKKLNNQERVEEHKAIDVLDTLRMQFAVKYYFESNDRNMSSRKLQLENEVI